LPELASGKYEALPSLKIGFYGNANNYPFILARAVRALGHEVVFLVASAERLNRPENLFADIPPPYPAWIIDVSHRFRWHCLVPCLGRKSVIDRLNSCDCAILNEEGPALAGDLRIPYGVLLTGSDIEVFANPALAETLKPQVFNKPKWASRLSRHFIPTEVVMRRLVMPQRAGIKSARFVAFLPRGLVPKADRLLEEIGVSPARRIEFQFTDSNFEPFAPPPTNVIPRLFSATRLNWIVQPTETLTPLDLKGSDKMLLGIAQFWRQTNRKLDIHLVRKGRHVAETLSLAAELGIQDQITWHEEMTQEDVREQFRQADIVLEQFGSSAVGMAGFDAMALGRPLIANGRPEVLSLITGEVSPICQASTPEEICAQLVRLTQSSEERLRIGLAGRKYVQTHFSAESAARRLLAAFSDG
jgi:glycosyltransferase involved in cell wall biosynthesis